MRCNFALDKDEIISTFSEDGCYYVLYGHTDSDSPVIFSEVKNIPSLGESVSGDKNHDNRYLIVKKDISINSRKIKRNDGTVVWAWDNSTVDAPIVCFGGAYDGKVLIGEISVQSHLTKESKNLYSRIVRQIGKISTKHNDVNIGDHYYKDKQVLTYSTRINPDHDFRYK